jgi:hypothetical protein
MTRAPCYGKHCGAAAFTFCGYPIKRRGRDATCGRFLCKRCARSVAPRSWFCPPHARLLEAAEKARREREAEERKFREIMSGFRPSAEVEKEGK